MSRTHRAYDVVKRILDVLTAAVLLVVLSPVLLITALLVRVMLGSPVLFTQQRPGRGGRVFTLYKFRSMHDALLGESAVSAVGSDAQRLTRFGRILRSSSLDELPELVNVLLGQMSIVGPRPLLVEYLPRYNDLQARRHEVRPGITGWAQVNGRNAVSWDERFAMDVWYVDNRSFLLDFRILARTVSTVFRRDGVSATGHATMEPFGGNVTTQSDQEDS
ncbi:MAG: sugar transferase [Coriobacteriia bacterium]|nr:sugar transferase [Coriobacteriia bacterium]